MRFILFHHSIFQTIHIKQVNRGMRQQAMKSFMKHRCPSYYRTKEHPPATRVQSELKIPNEAEQTYQSQTRPREPVTFCDILSSCISRNPSGKFQKENSRNIDIESGLDERENAKVYSFDHGSPLFYQTTDWTPHLISDDVARRTQIKATKFWAEFFGFINVFVTFFVTFFIQFYR